MEFGVFDHLDRSDLTLRDYYEARLELIEAYEEAGAATYHVAEHHATPLGMAPSPAVFLAAVAQRTSSLRFGPMVFALPLYHPLRLVEEICMLDQMSGGRLEIGFGRGASPIENAYFGVTPDDAQRRYEEGLEIVLQGLTTGRLDHRGEFYRFEDVGLCLEPLQRPHPPLWYGVHAAESAARAARKGMNVVSLDTAAETRSFFERFRDVWSETRGDEALPRMALGRFIVVGDSDAAALEAARYAYPVWHANFTFLFRKFGHRPSHPRPPDFDTLRAIGKGFAGTPETVAAALQVELAESGANYVMGQFAFGDLPIATCLRSIELFRREVLPALAG